MKINFWILVIVIFCFASQWIRAEEMDSVMSLDGSSNIENIVDEAYEVGFEGTDSQELTSNEALESEEGNSSFRNESKMLNQGFNAEDVP